MAKRKKDLWEDVIRETHLDLSKPVSKITTQEVKRIAKYEPRLLAKMDEESDLPEIFRRNKVFLLPVSRNEYVIVKWCGYHRVEPVTSPPIVHEANVPLELSLLLQRKETESVALDYAYQTDLLRKFLEVPNLYLYARGRFDTPNFHSG